ncbi:MAG: GIY-YIG nuclease family protein [Myxococcales bacterium]|nr:GIY-YIG nuclease family protein [Myxococcales bacterium]
MRSIPRPASSSGALTASPNPADGPWTTYIVRCADDTLYTGIAKDLHARLKAHNRGKGAKYTAQRRPVHLCYLEYAPDRSAASKREHAIKQMTRAEKMRLIHSAQPAVHMFMHGAETPQPQED